MEVTNIESVAMLPKVAVFFDDEIGTIEPHMDRAKAQGVFPVVAKGIPELFKLMKRLKDRAVFFLDMHVPGEQNFGAVQCPDIETGNGSAFGTAAYRTFLKLNNEQPLKFANILSGRPIDKAAYQVLSELEDYGFLIEDIDKSNKQDFDDALRYYVENIDISEDNGEVSPISAHPEAMEKIEVTSSILEELFPEKSTDEIVTLALGFRKEEAKDFDYIKALAAEILSRGEHSIQTRIDFIAYIKAGLSSILGVENLEAQRVWMTSSNDFLEGKTPLEMIESQDINDLALVAALVNRILS